MVRKWYMYVALMLFFLLFVLCDVMVVWSHHHHQQQEGQGGGITCDAENVEDLTAAINVSRIHSSLL